MLLPLGDKPSCIADRLANSLCHWWKWPTNSQSNGGFVLNVYLGSIWVVRPVWGASACTASALRVKVNHSDPDKAQYLYIFMTNVCFLTLVTGDYLGGEAYWAGGLHLYTPLPFRPGRGGFGDLFRTHFFLNAGNLCNLNYGKIYNAVKGKFFSFYFIKHAVFTYICCSTRGRAEGTSEQTGRVYPLVLWSGHCVASGEHCSSGAQLLHSHGRPERRQVDNHRHSIN